MKGRGWRQEKVLFGVPVPGAGPQPADIMLIGDRPSKGEPSAGRPYTAAAGAELERYLGLAGIQRPSIYVTYLVKDYGDWETSEEEIARDSCEVLEEIARVSPRLVIAAGRVPIRWLLGDVDVEQVHGLVHRHPDWEFDILPVYAPTAGLHSADNIPLIHWDFAALRGLDERRLPIDRFGEGCTYRPATGRDWLDHDLPLYLDSEGWLARPYSLQWTQRPGQGFMVYAGAPAQIFAAQYNRYWAAGGITYVHNSMHDIGVLRRMGIELRDGSYIDTMVLAYNLCIHPQGLKALSYRLAGMKMQSYEDVVAPARESVEQEWLAGAAAVAPTIPPPPEELVWDDKKGEWRIKKPQTIEQRIRRIYTDLDKGIPVNISKRVKAWEDDAAAALLDVCGEVTEPTLADIPAIDSERYSCRDADATSRVAPVLWQQIVDRGMEELTRIDHSILPMVDRMQEVGFLIAPDHFHTMDDRLTEAMSNKRDEIEAMVGTRINPGSSPQVAALLFKQLGLPSRKLTKGGDDSTQDKVLEALRHDHPVVPLILDYRELDKMRGSFCRKMPRLASSDHRVRGRIRVTRTASGRLSMTDPNLMAIPVRSALGRELRQGFIARPGHVICNWDLDQIEMRLIADESEDPLLCELFSDPNRDIHSETAAGMFGRVIDYSQPHHLWYAGIDPKTERYAAKRVGFGIATQITGRGLVDQMELAGARHADGSRWTEAECDDLIVRWFGVYPPVRRFIDRTKAEVRRTGEVVDRWGRLRLLHGVWSTVERIREECLRQGPSHKIQAGAQGLMKKGMARAWEYIKPYTGRGTELGPIEPLLQIHDSLMLEVREDLVPLANAMVLDALENTVKLRVPVTASGEWGYNWGQPHDIE